ncbi:MAG: DUF3179 domain-containing protein [Anaerolineae bacterium]|nr:DUF3179 domain-containing protein [Anaerolineae bacterium]
MKNRHYLLLLISLLVLTVVACSPAEPTPENSADATDVSAVLVTESAEADPDIVADPDPTVESDPAAEADDDTIDPTQPLTDADVRKLMYDLSDGRRDEALAALETAVASGDDRFIPVLIELMRAGQIGIVPWALDQREQLAAALDELAGTDIGYDWPAWIEWYGATDIEPPAEFTSWKGRILAEIDPAFGTFFQDSFPSDIRVEEIQWGGVVLDGIPALDNPNFVDADKATYLAPDEPVFGLSFNGDSRAYPLRIMDWHEMANDIVGGVPVSIAYCTLCGAAVAYDGRASDGETYTFGSSGFLLRSNKLMYDRQTKTLWNQLTGQPALGPLVDSGVTLDILPIVLTTWREWQNQHPDTVVLDIDTGFSRLYERGAAYADYFSSPDTMFPVWQRSELLPDKSNVYALRLDGVPKAYPIDVVTEEIVVNDTVGETNVVLIAPNGIVETTGTSYRSSREAAYIPGAEVRAYERNEHTFTPGDDSNTVIDESGAVWQVTEDALVGPDSATLARVGGHLAYWFGWFAFFPNTLVYGQ